MSDVAKTPREELECEKKYLYEYGMFWECNDGSKCQILEDDVVDLLNEQQAMIELYKRSVNKREEQISIIKNHCLKFLTDEQIETIRKALEDE